MAQGLQSKPHIPTPARICDYFLLDMPTRAPSLTPSCQHYPLPPLSTHSHPNPGCEVFNNLKTKYGVMETHTDHNKVWLYKDEYDDLFEYIDRLKETIDFLSDKNAVAEVKTALANIASGDYLTKEDMVSD